jgi:hypothetical protein
MKTLYIHLKIIFFLALFLLPASCGEKIEQDPCQLTQWNLPKEYEVKLAVHISSTNPNLPGGSAGSVKPEDFQAMVVSGTIEKFECSDSASGPVNLGNSYVDKDIDYPAPVDVSGSYWIGHVVYVYEFDNDVDYLNLNLSVKITMLDGQSYTCSFSQQVYSEDIELVPGEMYYYVLLDIFSDSWVKV